MPSETRFRYVVGDIQGCYVTLRALLARCEFDPVLDRLWVAGDLINRGPKNVEVLRYLRGLGERCQCVLGNHDFFLLAVIAGAVKHDPCDTLEDILDAPDRNELVDWLRCKPLIHVEGQSAMVHAGLLPQWSVERAVQLAAEVEAQLRSRDWKTFLRSIWGGKPTEWSDRLQGEDRSRIIVNTFCRMRFLRPDGSLALKPKGTPEDNPGFVPWYAAPSPQWVDHTIYHGHWSALGFRDMGNVLSLDSGCVWGGQLTAVRMEDRQVFQVDAVDDNLPDGWE
jgi:bis(5'-nucleosyl)-tetraphosphatase (symmetrical)